MPNTITAQLLDLADSLGGSGTKCNISAQDERQSEPQRLHNLRSRAYKRQGRDSFPGILAIDNHAFRFLPFVYGSRQHHCDD